MEQTVQNKPIPHLLQDLGSKETFHAMLAFALTSQSELTTNSLTREWKSPANLDRAATAWEWIRT